MNEELKKLLDSIKSKKQQVKDFAAAGKFEDATKAKAELKDLQNQFDLIYDLEEEAEDIIKNKITSGTAKTIVDATKKVAGAFVNAIKVAVQNANPMVIKSVYPKRTRKFLIR